MSFQAPMFLAALLVPAVAVAAYVWWQRRPSRFAVEFPNLDVLRGVAAHTTSWRRHLVLGLFAAALVLLCASVARPHLTLLVPSERATVVLALDVSGSMRADDVAPSRLEAARRAVARFLDRAPKQIRIGLVLFSSEPYTAVPPTHDHDLVRGALEGALPQFGTAIGDAVARSAELAESAVRDARPVEGEVASAILAAETTPQPDDLATVVFLSDGFQTRGVLSPQEGAQRAREARTRVHTIALGTDSGTIEVERWGELRVIPVPPDRQTLAMIAQTTGGKAFDVRDEDRLVDVYDELGSSVGRTEEEREVTAALVGVAGLLVAVCGICAAFWAPRLP